MTKRILVVNGMQKAVLGPVPITILGLYNFGVDEPMLGDTIEWADGRSYEITRRLWRSDGSYDVIVRTASGYKEVSKGEK